MRRPGKAELAATLKTYLALPETELPSWIEAFTSGRVTARTASRVNLPGWYTLEEHRDGCGAYKIELGQELLGNWPMLGRYLEHLRDVRREGIDARLPKALPSGPMQRLAISKPLAVMQRQMEVEQKVLSAKAASWDVLRPMNHRDRWLNAGGEGEPPGVVRDFWFEFWDTVNRLRQDRAAARLADPVAYDEEHGTRRSSELLGAGPVQPPNPKPAGAQRLQWVSYARTLLEDGVHRDDVSRLIRNMGIDHGVTKAVVATAARDR